MNSTAQHSLSPLVQYNQVISSCFLYSIYGKKSAFVRGLNKSCITSNPQLSSSASFLRLNVLSSLN